MRRTSTHQNKPRSQKGSRFGFALLMVVALIAVASLLLARLANTSMRIASTAVSEEQQMRKRWAITSLRQYTLEQADEILASDFNSDSGQTDQNFEAVIWKDVTLASETWRVILSDESAKVNLNHFAKKQDSQSIERIISELQSTRSNVRPQFELAAKTETSNHRWENWLNCSINVSTGNRDSIARRTAAATQRLTLWGDGKINVCRSDTETLDQLWLNLFGRRAPSRLHKSRMRRPPIPTNQMLGSLGLRDPQLAIARDWIKTDSNCFSVWIFCQSDDRVPASLFVEWGDTKQSRDHRGYEY